MRELEINLLLQKAEELKALFVLGQRVIPFLEEIFMFIKDITPLLDEINFSIEENLAKMPKASQQLSQVTQATELATTEILDTLDGMSFKSDVISGNLKQILALQEKQASIVSSLQNIVARHSSTENRESSTINELVKLLQSLSNAPASDDTIASIPTLDEVNLTPEVSNILNNSEDMLESIRMDTTQIMMALQVQDITSQQLAAVNNLLQTVQSRLGQIMVQFKGSDLGDLIGVAAAKAQVAQNPAPTATGSKSSEMHRTIAFDEEAISALDPNLKRQDMVNDILNNFGTDTPSLSEPASADDISALFAGANSTIPPALNEPASADDINALFASATVPTAANLNEPATADDINALFAAQSKTSLDTSAISDTPSQDEIASMFGSVSDKPSQNDIDALFGKA